jgi:hypothetical protein
MKYIKTYEGLFDFLKKKKPDLEKIAREQKSDKEHCDNITEEIIDSMWDIFDQYNIDDATTLDKWTSCTPGGLHWKYNNTTLNDGTKVNCGIIIKGIDLLTKSNEVGAKCAEILEEIYKIIPIINGRTGISLNDPHAAKGGIIIDFPMYMSSNKRRRGW